MKGKILKVFAVILILFIVYMLGHSQGQASAYKKITDGTTIEDIYKMGK